MDALIEGALSSGATETDDLPVSFRRRFPSIEAGDEIEIVLSKTL